VRAPGYDSCKGPTLRAERRGGSPPAHPRLTGTTPSPAIRLDGRRLPDAFHPRPRLISDRSVPHRDAGRYPSASSNHMLYGISPMSSRRLAAEGAQRSYVPYGHDW